MRSRFSARQQLWLALAVASVAAVFLYGWGAARNQNLDFWYLPYNLALAFIPLLLAVWLVWLLQKHAWKSWLPLFATALWVLFLPNSFYVVSDFIHLTETPRVDVTQDIVMLAQFSLLGFVFGFISLYSIHQEFIKRISVRLAAPLVAVLLLLCSFAIYLGRDLRWNSWDIITQPWTLIFDIFEHVLNPLDNPQMITTTVSFFMMLSSVYFVIWQVGRTLAAKSSK